MSNFRTETDSLGEIHSLYIGIGAYSGLMQTVSPSSSSTVQPLGGGDSRWLADQVSDYEAKQTMLRIANDYDHLAERARQRRIGATQ
jgi:hypothetical protein